MEFHTFKAKSIADALRMVRERLGPDASVLHTRDIGPAWVRLIGLRTIEVTASAEIEAPSRLSPLDQSANSLPSAELLNFRQKFREDLMTRAAFEESVVEQLAQRESQQAAKRRGQAATAVEATSRRWLDRFQAELVCDPECHPERRRERFEELMHAEVNATH
jgi:flagellar biosynthesis GTPase FlhF